ncbi:MAG: Sec-independent protein translocase protein TatB [Thermodesulfovibrionales bacterium]
MFDLGMQELIVIFIVALLVFGPKKLPELGRTIGKGIAELKRAMQGVKEQIDSEIDLTSSHRPYIDTGLGKEEENKSDVTDESLETKKTEDETIEDQGSSVVGVKEVNKRND